MNDSLVMVDFVNRNRAKGTAVVLSACNAGKSRFRAILLTSLTTFMGLIPIIFEQSMQAKIVIPMAVSLAFGILFSTVITLILIPILYAVMEDIRTFFLTWHDLQPFDRKLQKENLNHVVPEKILDGTARPIVGNLYA